MDGKVKAQRAQSCFPGNSQYSAHSLSFTSAMSPTGPAAPQGPEEPFWREAALRACLSSPPGRQGPAPHCRWTRSPSQQSWAALPPATFLLSSPQGAVTLACLGSREAPVPLPKRQNPGTLLPLGRSCPMLPPSAENQGPFTGQNKNVCNCRLQVSF